MAINTANRKNIIRVILAIVLVLDIILLVVNWKLSSSPQASPQQVRSLEDRRKLIEADVRRAEDIRKSLPSVEAETNTFFQEDLRPGAAGYSSVLDDLGKLAKESGLQIASSIKFQPTEAQNRGVQEIKVTIIMQGQYPALVSFINALERSSSFLLLDSLSLESSSEGSLKLNMTLRTYFRS